MHLKKITILTLMRFMTARSLQKKVVCLRSINYDALRRKANVWVKIFFYSGKKKLWNWEGKVMMPRPLDNA